jgi:tetratricopeptide (TPR) repeat protein
MTAPKFLIAFALSLGIVGCASNSEPKEAKLDSQTYYAAGQLAEAQHNYPHAINEYRLAIAAQGPHSSSIYRLGIIYTQLKDYPHAIDAWKQYVAATYGAALAYGDLAYAYQLAGRYADARQAYEAALKKEPANPTCRFNYGRLLAQQGDIPAAETQMRDILPDAQMHYAIGLICQDQKNYPQARSEFTQAIFLNPQLLDAKARLIELDSVSSAK